MYILKHTYLYIYIYIYKYIHITTYIMCIYTYTSNHVYVKIILFVGTIATVGIPSGCSCSLDTLQNQTMAFRADDGHDALLGCGQSCPPWNIQRHAKCSLKAALGVSWRVFHSLESLRSRQIHCLKSTFRIFSSWCGSSIMFESTPTQGLG